MPGPAERRAKLGVFRAWLSISWLRNVPGRFNLSQLPFAFRTALMMVAVVAALSGCASPPDFDEVARTTPGAIPRLKGVRGPLTERQSQAVLDRLRASHANSDVLQRHLAFEEAITNTPLTVGNKVTLLHDGTASFDAIFDAIAAAKDHVNLEYYIFEDVEHRGQHLVDLLAAKQRAGVQVNVIYDSLGSADTPNEVFDRLKSSGIKMLSFHPFDATGGRADYSINDRDHRKILVVDGTTGIIGGVNLSKVYSSNPLADRDKEAPSPETWRDTDLKIEGPAVADLERLFLDNWSQQNGGPLNQANFFPQQEARDGQVVRIIGSTPERSQPLFYITLLSAIRNAEQRIWISTGYFVPTHQEIELLIAAARRGVDVRLLLPSHTDNQFTVDVARSHYGDLLEAGVRIYELQHGILHSKIAVIDGVWSAVGSSNFDGRSVLFNDEVDAVVLGRETAAQLEAAFTDDVAQSDGIDLANWRERPLAQKFDEFISKLWSYWM